MKVDRKKLAEVCEVSVKIEQDDLDYRGNALASGDDAADQACEDEIARRLDAGDVFAWFCAVYTATYQGHSAHASLGGCSYASMADFEQHEGANLREDAIEQLALWIERATAQASLIAEVKRNVAKIERQCRAVSLRGGK